MTVALPIVERNGIFSVMLRSCTASILTHILDPDVPVVWIRHHRPNGHLQWWNVRVPLSESGGLCDVEVRLMDFDIQLSTIRFIELISEFEDHGLELFQMSTRVPNTLTLEGISEDSVNQVLIQNGMHLHFNLPHAFECAQLSSPDRGVLERALQRPMVKEIAY